MSFPVAVQSAIFYFMACTPCMSARNRHRAKKKFDRERKERAALEEDGPPLYRHPSPFNVNPYWQEEIMMGPSLPKKGRAKHNQSHGLSQTRNPSQRKLTSSGQDSSMATRSSLVISSHGGHGAPTGGDGTSRGANSTSGGGSSSTGNDSRASMSGTGSGGDAAVSQPPTTAEAAATTAAYPTRASTEKTSTMAAVELNTNEHTTTSPVHVADDAHSMSMLEGTASATTISEGWNYKRYQREDEELWGSEPSRAHRLMDAIVKAGSSAGRLLESTLGKERSTVTDEDRANFYAPTIIHPPVNEYHPPVVSSKPAHKDALRWMLQPPPPAKVMEGKVPVSRSTSVASSANGSTVGISAGRRLAAASAAAGSEVSLTQRMALEARLRRIDSSNSGITMSTRRPRATSSTDGLGLGLGLGMPEADLGALGNSPTRSASSRHRAACGAEYRPKGQARLNSAGQSSGAVRSRSGSLASSVDGAMCRSSDEDGLLHVAHRRLPAKGVVAQTNGPDDPFGFGKAVPAMSVASAPMRVKLETIPSSGTGGRADRKASATRQSEKENRAPSHTGSHGSDSSDAGRCDNRNVVKQEGMPKISHDRPAGASLDSGMSLSA